MHRWVLLHAAGRAFAMAMRAVPRRYRFSAAVRASALLRGIIRRTEVYREARSNSFDTVAEVALFHVLRVMTEHGTEFDIQWVVEGVDHVADSCASGHGVLMIAPHSMLITLVPRYVYDHGRLPTLVAMRPGYRLFGTVVEAHVVCPSPSFLIGIRRTLRSDGIVCSMIDQPQSPPNRRRSREFMTHRGPVLITDALIRIATRCGARVVFGVVRVSGGRVVAAFDVPSPLSAGDPERVTRDFIAFVERHAVSLPVMPGEGEVARELEYREPA